MAGAKIVGIEKVDDDLGALAGCLLEAEGSFFLAVAPVRRARKALRWADLVPGLACEVKYEDVWYQVRITKALPDTIAAILALFKSTLPFRFLAFTFCITHTPGTRRREDGRLHRGGIRGLR